MKTKETMVPGKRYRGWGFVNEYKEFCFEPEHTGANAGKIKAVTQGEGYSLKESTKYVLVSMKLRKKQGLSGVLADFFRLVNVLTQKLREYDF